MSNLPKIIVANIGDIGIEQTYENMEVVQADNNIHPPDFFNDMYDKHPHGDIYAFLPNGYTCATPTTLARIVTKMGDNQYFAGVYTDAYITIKGHRTHTFMPAYDRSIIYSKNVINVPIVFSKKCRPAFDSRIQHMFFGQVFIAASHRFLFCHIAEALFEIDPGDTSSQTIQSDLHIIELFRKAN